MIQTDNSNADMVVFRAGSSKAIPGLADWFTGRVRIDRIFTAPAPARVGIAVVNFEPGARTNWHTHPLGQASWSPMAWVGRNARMGRRPRSERAT